MQKAPLQEVCESGLNLNSVSFYGLTELNISNADDVTLVDVNVVNPEGSINLNNVDAASFSPEVGLPDSWEVGLPDPWEVGLPDPWESSPCPEGPTVLAKPLQNVWSPNIIKGLMIHDPATTALIIDNSNIVMHSSFVFTDKTETMISVRNNSKDVMVDGGFPINGLEVDASSTFEMYKTVRTFVGDFQKGIPSELTIRVTNGSGETLVYETFSEEAGTLGYPILTWRQSGDNYAYNGPFTTTVTATWADGARLNKTITDSLVTSANYIYLEGEPVDVQQPLSVNWLPEVLPNPVMARTVLIRLNNIQSWNEAHASLFDLNGRIVWTGEFEDASIELDTQDLPAGVYLVRVNVDGLEKQTKLVMLQ
jgi:hypothetical protein